MSRRHNVPFSAILGKKRHRVAIFWPKKLIKKSKIFKNIFNVLKIMVERKEKRFWKAYFPNKKIGYWKIWLFNFEGLFGGPQNPHFEGFWGPQIPPKIKKVNFFNSLSFHLENKLSKTVFLFVLPLF